MIKRLLILLLCATLPAPALTGGYGGYRYGGYYHGHGDGDEGVALLAGLLIGGLVGYFVSEDRYYRRSYYPPYRYDPGYDPYYGRVYYQPVYREYVRVVPAPPRVVVRDSPEFAGQSCRMTREYTTTIEIDGRPREAYGTKCLTADGSWVLGAPRLVPDFE